MSSRSMAAWLAATSIFFAFGAFAQDAPSWRSGAPERQEAPPEMERPEFEFKINREDLFSDDSIIGEDDRPSEEEVIAAPAAEPDSLPVNELPATAEEVVYSEPETVIDEPVVLEPEAVIPEDSNQVASLTPEPTPAPALDLPIESEIQSVSSGFKLTRIKQVAPQYPRHAWLSGQEGWVELRLTVSPQGKVTDVEVLGAEPRRVFEKSALRAAMKWRFEPPADAGLNEDQRGRFRIAFTMDG